MNNTINKTVGRTLNQIIYLLRHRETVFNKKECYQGELDSPLTEVGIDQVRQNAETVKSVIGNPNEWKVVFSSLG